MTGPAPSATPAGNPLQRARSGPAPRTWRLGLLVGLLTITSISSFSVAEAKTRVLTLPRVKATTSTIDDNGRTAILLRSLLVTRIHGNLKASCNGCLRLIGDSRDTRLSHTSRRFSNVNWILHSGRGVRVTVVRRGWVGRYLLLTTRRRHGRLSLGYKRTGCVNRFRKTVRCPRKTTPPKPPLIVILPPPPPPPPPPARPACSDGIDNDGDGKTDSPADAQCYSATDPSERNLACGDRVDNDGDHAIDWPADDNCSSPEDPSEQNFSCSDGKDNDGDGATDVPADIGCSSPDDPAEKQPAG